LPGPVQPHSLRLLETARRKTEIDPEAPSLALEDLDDELEDDAA
jgi:hypothetical protein